MTDLNNDYPIDVIRHSFAHILAMAVLRIFSEAKIGVGAVVENGFYHDFQFGQPIQKKDLEKIEKEMRMIIKEQLPMQQIIVTKDQAFDMLHLQGQIFKTEILSNIDDEQVSFYKTGQDFIDLCRGPHVENTGDLSVFQLTGISGVHWNNDESRPNMQRIHGIAFKNKDELNEFLDSEEKKKEHDHKIIIRKMKYVNFDSKIGKGFPIWLPKGFAIREQIINYIKSENKKEDYKYIETPALLERKVKKDDKQEVEYQFRKDIYQSHFAVFKDKKRSYKELPFKTAEMTCRFVEKLNGELNGLFITNTFAKDESVILCTKNQIKEQIKEQIYHFMKIMGDFGLQEKFVLKIAMNGPAGQGYKGSPKKWDQYQNMVFDITKNLNVRVKEAPNTARLEGPGLHLVVEDVHNREWLVGEILIDLEAVKKYGVKYINNRNKERDPMVLYVSRLGSIERFFALLVENTGNMLPIWLSPVQVNIIPISNKFVEYARQIYGEIIDQGINVSLDESTETMQNKIRLSQSEMIPYMLIVGEKEMSTKTVSVRPRSGQDLGIMRIEDFIQKVKEEIHSKVNF